MGTLGFQASMERMLMWVCLHPWTIGHHLYILLSDEYLSTQEKKYPAGLSNYEFALSQQALSLYFYGLCLSWAWSDWTMAVDGWVGPGRPVAVRHHGLRVQQSAHVVTLPITICVRASSHKAEYREQEGKWDDQRACILIELISLDVNLCSWKNREGENLSLLVRLIYRRKRILGTHQA